MADHQYDMDEAKARVARVFRYLQELHRVKTPPTVDLDKYDWRLPLEALPSYPSLQRGPLFGNLKSLSSRGSLHEGNFLLKVGRPRESECPPPSVVIEQWLKPGWENAGAEPKVFERRKNKATGEEEEFEGVRAAQEQGDRRGGGVRGVDRARDRPGGLAQRADPLGQCREARPGSAGDLLQPL
jgi:hypothetical protein